jgi:lipoprotein-anchoring transpeptidase ErfK/SrfK
MRGLLVSGAAVGQLLLAQPAAAQHRPVRKTQHAVRKEAPKAPPIDKQMLATQVMLDCAGYSPGEIDARHGSNSDRALAAFASHGGDPTALPQDALTDYTITSEDAAGPFTQSIPPDLMAMAKLTSLDYTNLVEMLGERFHASPALLRRLNPEATFDAGETITVPNVEQGMAAAGRKNDPSSPMATTVTVRKSSSDLLATDKAGNVLMYAPVTTGSEHDPLPIGTWQVNGVQHNPTFHYNPALFWDANTADTKATIPAGPNNPVGVVWIDISHPHYGLHGTPEPSRIGKTTSHGCVRLTNWDALKLSALVRPGTRVVFAE